MSQLCGQLSDCISFGKIEQSSLEAYHSEIVDKISFLCQTPRGFYRPKISGKQTVNIPAYMKERLREFGH
jgi:hypothetical protein